MRTAVLTMLALFLALTPAYGQEWAKKNLESSPRHMEWVSIKHGDRNLKCFVAYPEKKEKATIIIVVHEIFGLTDWVRSMADQFAERGYVAIAPDLLSGQGPGGGDTSSFASEDDVRKAITGLPQEQITADLNAVTQYAVDLPATNGKIAVAGFCWGGTQAFKFAAEDARLKGSLVFYGKGPDSMNEIDRIKCPVYGFYGENDARVTSTLSKTKKQMKDALKSFDSVVYEDAGHGFMRAGEAPDALVANKKARDEAWTRVEQVLEKIAKSTAARDINTVFTYNF